MWRLSMRLGLRAKSGLAVALSAAIVLLLAGLVGLRALKAVQSNLGQAFARNATQFNKQRLLTPVLRELALSQRLADSQLLRAWLQNPDNAQTKALFFLEARGFQNAFSDKTFFVADIARRTYYLNDASRPFSDQPRQTFDPKAVSDEWFFNSVRLTETYNINVDFNELTRQSKVFINVLTREGGNPQGRKLAIAGTGLDLTRFLQTFVSNREQGVTPMILGAHGAIQAHPNPKLIALNSGSGGEASSTIFRLIAPAEWVALQSALGATAKKPDSVELLDVTLAGKPQTLAVAFVPELQWHVVTAVDLGAAQLFDTQALALPLALGAGLLLCLLFAISLAVNRVILSPLLKLTDSVRAVQSGNYDVKLPESKSDEIGDLSRAFGAMTQQIRAHTDELESRIVQRTAQLQTANEGLALANRQIGDSIEYARHIQSAVLPGAQIQAHLGEKAAALWLPRDTVGGDFFLFRPLPDGVILGIVDCAGHGVAGALMTMVAHGAFQSAMDETENGDPASILSRADAIIRSSLLEESHQSKMVATNMDAAIVAVNFGSQTLRFSGAKLDLFWSDGQGSEIWKGERSVLGGKKIPTFQTQSIPARGGTFALCSDGFLDQNGGEKGFAFGTARWLQTLQSVATLPPATQKIALEKILRDYRGALPQRDDVTVLSFQL